MLPLWITVLTLAGVIVVPPIYFLFAPVEIDRRLKRHVKEMRASLNVTSSPHSSQLNASKFRKFRRDGHSPSLSPLWSIRTEMTFVAAYPERRSRERGSQMVEAAIVLSLLIFFLIGVFDLGFYLYACVSIGNAARIAALDTAATSLTAANSVLACADVQSDLQSLINSSSFSSTCATGPLTVSARLVNGPDGAAATLVAVHYTLPLLQFPWLPDTFSASGFAEMRVRGQ